MAAGAAGRDAGRGAHRPGAPADGDGRGRRRVRRAVRDDRRARPRRGADGPGARAARAGGRHGHDGLHRGAPVVPARPGAGAAAPGRERADRPGLRGRGVDGAAARRCAGAVPVRAAGRPGERGLVRRVRRPARDRPRRGAGTARARGPRPAARARRGRALGLPAPDAGAVRGLAAPVVPGQLDRDDRAGLLRRHRPRDRRGHHGSGARVVRGGRGARRRALPASRGAVRPGPGLRGGRLADRGGVRLRAARPPGAGRRGPPRAGPAAVGPRQRHHQPLDAELPQRGDAACAARTDERDDPLPQLGLDRGLGAAGRAGGHRLGQPAGHRRRRGRARRRLARPHALAVPAGPDARRSRPPPSLRT